jgi:hypothetical protein
MTAHTHGGTDAPECTTCTTPTGAMSVRHTWRREGSQIVDEHFICTLHQVDLVCPADAARQRRIYELMAQVYLTMLTELGVSASEVRARLDEAEENSRVR